MNVLDVVLVGAAVLALIGGYRLGFTTRVLSWVGLAVGLLVGMRVLPRALEKVDPVDHVRVVLVTVGVVLVFAAIGQAVGLWAGNRLAPDLTGRGAVAADRALGAVAGLVGLIALVWLILPVLAATPGWPGQLTTGSSVARAIDDDLPDPPDLSQALRSLVGADNYPQVFDALRPDAAIGAPPPESGLTDAVAATAARSVVKVEGVACRRIQDGTGCVVAEDLVVTNAHVVAGERSSEIMRDDGRKVDAEVVAFDPDRDLALLQVSGSTARPSPSPRPAGRDGRRVRPPRRRAAAHRPVRGGPGARRHRQGHLRHRPHPPPGARAGSRPPPGDSGSALIDRQGEVVGVAFAISPEQAGVAYALATSELTPVLAGPHDAPVSTGPCIG